MDKTETKAETKAAGARKDAPVYTTAQLVDGYKTFGTTRAIVECALKLAGKDRFTVDEAKKLADRFKNRR